MSENHFAVEIDDIEALRTVKPDEIIDIPWYLLIKLRVGFPSMPNEIGIEVETPDGLYFGVLDFCKKERV